MPYDDLTGIKRQFWRWLFLGLMVVTLVNLGLHFNSMEDRRRLQRNTDLARQMLDARARIQIAVIETGCRRNAFTDDEKDVIRQNWAQAEFTEVASSVLECLK